MQAAKYQNNTINFYNNFVLIDILYYLTPTIVVSEKSLAKVNTLKYGIWKDKGVEN